MAHFARIDENNIVQQVVVVHNNDALSGHAFLNSIGLTGTWIQTSYNTIRNTHTSGGTPLRGNYAGVGYRYDPVKDVFIPPQPHPSWVLDNDTHWWYAPVSYPTDGGIYAWNESTISWTLILAASDVPNVLASTIPAISGMSGMASTASISRYTSNRGVSSIN
jgi:hypothetical protein